MGVCQLSVAIITYNEEKNIAECITSCLEIASEIVVLDSYSTDKTIEIAASFERVTIHQHPFDGHIEQKNRAIALCQNKWVLALDADERVSDDLRRLIQQTLANNPDKDGYKIKRLTFHMGRFIRHSGWYPQYRYRLFKKDRASWVGENPHDYIQLNGQGGKLSADIIHYSFFDLSEQIETINKFSSIVSFTRHHKGQNFSVFKSIWKPMGKFLEIYFFKRGFLDGYPGFVIAAASSFSTFLKFAKIYEYDKAIIERPSNIRKDYGISKSN